MTAGNLPQQLMLSNEVVVLVGVDAAPQSVFDPGRLRTSDVAALLRLKASDLSALPAPSRMDEYNCHVKLQHIAEHFLSTSVVANGAMVYEHPALDAQEVSQEAKDDASRTGVCLEVAKEELRRRAVEFFQKPEYRNAGTIGLSRSSPEDC